MGKTHYLKREKEGKVIQLYIITELGDDFGSISHIKVDVDERYKKAFTFLRYPIPHEELTEISLEEFRELCHQLNCLSRPVSPVPGVPVTQNAPAPS